MKIFLKTFIIYLISILSTFQKKKIAIITIPLSNSQKILIKTNLKKDYPEKDYLQILSKMTYYPTSYKKWLNSEKIDSIPISIYNPNLLDYIKKMDGVILIGGNVDLMKSKILKINSEEKILKITELSEFSLKIKEVIKLVKVLNRERVFPLWGTCLGFQAIMLIEANLDLELNNIKNLNFFSNLKIWNKEDNILYNFFGKKIIDEFFENNNSFFFNHNFGFFMNYLKGKKSFWENFDVLATAKPKIQNLGDFLAIFKIKNYPIFGSQFHPEKIAFEKIHQNDFKSGHNFETDERILFLKSNFEKLDLQISENKQNKFLNLKNKKYRTLNQKNKIENITKEMDNFQNKIKKEINKIKNINPSEKKIELNNHDIFNKKLAENNLKENFGYINNLFVKFFIKGVVENNENSDIFQIISENQTSFLMNNIGSFREIEIIIEKKDWD